MDFDRQMQWNLKRDGYLSLISAVSNLRRAYQTDLQLRERASPAVSLADYILGGTQKANREWIAATEALGSELSTAALVVSPAVGACARRLVKEFGGANGGERNRLWPEARMAEFDRAIGEVLRLAKIDLEIFVEPEENQSERAVNELRSVASSLES